MQIEGKKTDQRFLKTKTALHDALYALARTTEYPKITISALTHKAQISRKTFYLHYNTVDDLMAEILRESMEKAEEAIEEQSSDDDPKDWLRRFFLSAFDALDQTFSSGPICNGETLSRLFHLAKEPLCEMLLRKLGPWGFGDVSQTEVNYRVSLWMGGLCSVYQAWLEDEDPKPPFDEFKVEFANILAHGVAASEEEART